MSTKVPDSTEFLQKTNDDVDAWMDGFYTEGRKAEFRLHCQWAWQEQERRHRVLHAELLEALELMAIDYHRKDGLGFDLLASTKMFAAINKAKGLAS